MIPILVSVVLLLASHVADWQLQCEQHGWKGLWWKNGNRAPRIAWYIEWLPRDAWHIAQVLRNWGQLAACIIMGLYWPFVDWYFPPAFVALYAITRGIGFTLPRKLTQGY